MGGMVGSGASFSVITYTCIFGKQEIKYWPIYTAYCVGDAAAFVETLHWMYLVSFFLLVFHLVVEIACH